MTRLSNWSLIMIFIISCFSIDKLNNGSVLLIYFTPNLYFLDCFQKEFVIEKICKRKIIYIIAILLAKFYPS